MIERYLDEPVHLDDMVNCDSINWSPRPGCMRMTHWRCGKCGKACCGAHFANHAGSWPPRNPHLMQPNVHRSVCRP